MRADALRPTTTQHASVAFRATVARHAASLKDVLRIARQRATAKQGVEWCRNIAKAVLSSVRCKAVDLLVALVVDAARRSDSPEHAEQIGLHLAAIARAEWAATHPEREAPQLSVREVQLLEEHYEGICDEAETAMAYEPSLANRMRYLAASAELTGVRRRLDEAVRRELARRDT